jgi:Flp pilus assembly protein TadG
MGITSGVRSGRVAPEPRVSLLRRQDGQALVEFALIAPLFLLLVGGIIQFGVALNFWLDLQRIANQGARWAVVNHYPGCPRDADPADCDQSLEDYLASSPVSGGLDPDVDICFEEMTGTGTPATATVGDPVTVRLTSQFDFVPIVGIGTLDLSGLATMRVEQEPTRYMADAC